MIDHTIKQQKMLNPRDRVLVAFSGGGDSVALLHMLWERRNSYGISVEAAHVNHNLRGAESLRDRDFAAEFCDKFGIRLHLLDVNIAELAELSGEGLEECGRRIRYEFFESVSADKIATAHTKSDLAETVILNLVRGAGLRGMAGIPAVRGKIIRPLIEYSREDIESYLDKNNLMYMTDSTNLQDEFSRNFVRIHIIPLLSRLNPLAIDKIAYTASSIRQDAVYLDGIARKILNSAENFGELYEISKIKSQPLPILTRILFLMAEERGIKLYKKNIDEMINSIHNNQNCSLPGGRSFFCSVGFCGIEPVNPPEIHEKPLDIPSEHNIFNGIIKISNISMVDFHKDKKIHNLLFKNLLDCDMIKGNPVIRGIRPGDKLNLPERGITKPLRKLFAESGIPAVFRPGVPVIADESGPIWVGGFGAHGRARIGENTINIAKIEYTRGSFHEK